jgi:hypothetical protein
MVSTIRASCAESGRYDAAGKSGNTVGSRRRPPSRAVALEPDLSVAGIGSTRMLTEWSLVNEAIENLRARLLLAPPDRWVNEC